MQKQVFTAVGNGRLGNDVQREFENAQSIANLQNDGVKTKPVDKRVIEFAASRQFAGNR
ncbi:MAG: hypothetical protein FWE57_11465 [Chitinispirillia bacterium]|nr:hypothetical protein [Chitinispirillia bacterium]